MSTFIIFLTVAISVVCFYNGRLFDRLSLKPYQAVHNHQWYRIITHGFVHGDWMHLIVNMLVFWSFSSVVLYVFRGQYYAGMAMDPNIKFSLLYFGGLVVASAYDIAKRKDNPYYTTIGASGAVSAVVFTSIFYAPLSKIYLMGIIPMPAILFGVLYIAFEAYSARRGGGNVNHHAHMFGAIYGFVFPVLTGGPSQMSFFLNGLGL